jgi:hypothetical protein
MVKDESSSRKNAVKQPEGEVLVNDSNRIKGNGKFTK